MVRFEPKLKKFWGEAQHLAQTPPGGRGHLLTNIMSQLENRT